MSGRCHLAILALAGLLTACGTCDLGGVQRQEIRAQGKMVFTGPFEQRDGSCRAAGDGVRLRTEADTVGGGVTHWLDSRLEMTGSGRSYWVAAEDRTGGRSLVMGMAQREKTGDCSRIMGWGCDQREEVSARIPEDILRAAAQSEDGLRIRFTRHSGFFSTATVAREQVRAHLDALDSWRQGQPRQP